MTNEPLPEPSVPQLTTPTQLAQLAASANDAHRRIDEAARKNLFDALEAGQHLLKAQKLCLGRWIVWLQHNFKGTVRTAQRYMAFAVECRRIGGLDATRVSRLTPLELGRIWTKLLREPSPRKKTNVANRRPVPSSALARQNTSAAESAASAPAVESSDVCAAVATSDGDDGSPHPRAEQQVYREPEGGATIATRDETDPLPPLAELFKKLIDGFRDVMNGDDERDGPYAEWMLMDIEPHYADLLEYLEYRKEWRQ
jgi:hypothetical protein